MKAKGIEQFYYERDAAKEFVRTLGLLSLIEHDRNSAKSVGVRSKAEVFHSGYEAVTPRGRRAKLICVVILRDHLTGGEEWIVAGFEHGRKDKVKAERAFHRAMLRIEVDLLDSAMGEGRN